GNRIFLQSAGGPALGMNHATASLTDVSLRVLAGAAPPNAPEDYGVGAYAAGDSSLFLRAFEIVDVPLYGVWAPFASLHMRDGTIAGAPVGLYVGANSIAEKPVGVVLRDDGAILQGDR